MTLSAQTGQTACPTMAVGSCEAGGTGDSPVQLILGHHTSVLGTLELDGKSAYKMETKGKSGRYTYDSANGRFTFTNGPLEGWPVVFEQGKNTFILRLAKSKDQSPNAKGPGLGEHSCTLK